MTLDPAWHRVISRHAAHIRYRDEYAKAYRTVARHPLFTIQGAANYPKLNADMFEKRGNAEDATAAKRLQDAERREEMQRMVEGIE